MFGGGVVRVFSTDAVPSTDVVVVGVPVVVVVVVVVALVVRLLFGGTLTEKKNRVILFCPNNHLKFVG